MTQETVQDNAPPVAGDNDIWLDGKPDPVLNLNNPVVRTLHDHACTYYDTVLPSAADKTIQEVQDAVRAALAKNREAAVEEITWGLLRRAYRHARDVVSEGLATVRNDYDD